MGLVLSGLSSYSCVDVCGSKGGQPFRLRPR